MLRPMFAAVALCAAAMLLAVPANAQINTQGLYVHYPYAKMAAKKARKAKAWKAKRSAYARRAYRTRHVSRTNIFRAYRAASASRSCLTSQTASILNALEARVGRVSVISTCRPGAVIAGSGRPSYHRYGMAVDFNTGNKAAAIAFLRTQPVLVMTYCNSGHVHFNTGQKGSIGCGYSSFSAARKKRWRR